MIKNKFASDVVPAIKRINRDNNDNGWYYYPGILLAEYIFSTRNYPANIFKIFDNILKKQEIHYKIIFNTEFLATTLRKYIKCITILSNKQCWLVGFTEFQWHKVPLGTCCAKIRSSKEKKL